MSQMVPGKVVSHLLDNVLYTLIYIFKYARSRYFVEHQCINHDMYLQTYAWCRTSAMYTNSDLAILKTVIIKIV